MDLSGITLNMNLTITPEAYLEILLDESTGDVIRGSAAGQLRMAIDTRGEFNMYGQVEIVRGAYNFTLQGLINKEFVVRPGGIISWNGDPLAGEMNVTATYTQRTSLAPVLGTASNGSAAVVPVTAVMNLTGPAAAAGHQAQPGVQRRAGHAAGRPGRFHRVAAQRRAGAEPPGIQPAGVQAAFAAGLALAAPFRCAARTTRCKTAWARF